LAVDGKITIVPADARRDRSYDQPFFVPISRVQLEQDTAQSTRLDLPAKAYEEYLVNYNRSSVPLIEIITPPVLTTPSHAAAAFAKIIEILRATGTSTAELHHGAIRCDVNVSLGYHSPKVEIKNLNSVTAVRKACLYEIRKQVDYWRRGAPIWPTTKTYNGHETVWTRVKPKEQDYRYTQTRLS
jgi:aspartyl-tRNA(Asn)/glutamyl-tRNA(Gln) amidotransferase subunit B